MEAHVRHSGTQWRLCTSFHYLLQTIGFFAIREIATIKPFVGFIKFFCFYDPWSCACEVHRTAYQPHCFNDTITRKSGLPNKSIVPNLEVESSAKFYLGKWDYSYVDITWFPKISPLGYWLLGWYLVMNDMASDMATVQNAKQKVSKIRCYCKLLQITKVQLPLPLLY